MTAFHRGVMGLAAIALLLVAVPRASAAERDVGISGFAFSPASVTVDIGDDVVWTNNDPTTHTVTSDDGSSFDSNELSPGARFRHRFTAAGTFAYHCEIHSSMRGTIVVRGPSTTTAAATTTTRPPTTTSTRAPTTSSSPTSTSAPSTIAPSTIATLATTSTSSSTSLPVIVPTTTPTSSGGDDDGPSAGLLALLAALLVGGGAAAWWLTHMWRSGRL